jgi:ABC-type uncharacterized transport system auxiliary subunit
MFHHSRSGRLFLLLVCLLAGAACGGAPRSNYYTLDITVPSAVSATRPGSQLGVEAPRASHLLRQDRIVYFNPENQVNFYQYHRWAEPPVFLVQSLLIRQLHAAGLFDEIVPFRAQKGLDYVLRGQLLAMEEVDQGDEVLARFALELELVREKDSHVVWTGRAERQRPITQKSVPALVTLLSECAEESLAELTESLGQTLAELPPPSGEGRDEP